MVENPSRRRFNSASNKRTPAAFRANIPVEMSRLELASARRQLFFPDKPSDFLNTIHHFFHQGAHLAICDPDTGRPFHKYRDRQATLATLLFEYNKHKAERLAIMVPPGYFVLDIEHKPQLAWDATKALDRLDLPPCPLARTPSGGFHAWFKTPAGVHIKAFPAHSLRSPQIGVEGKSPFQLVTLPPSRRPGGEYKWVQWQKKAPLLPNRLINTTKAQCPSPNITTELSAPTYSGNLSAYSRKALSDELHTVSTECVTIIPDCDPVGLQYAKTLLVALSCRDIGLSLAGLLGEDDH